MSVFTVHEPPPKKGRNAADPLRFAFVRDGFHFWAFLLTPLWMLYHRMWLVFVGYVAVCIALNVGAAAVGASAAGEIVSVLLSVLVGIEAGTLRRFTLRRWKTLGTVVGKNREEAERRFFAGWTAQESDKDFDVKPVTLMAAAPAAPVRADAAPDVIGLFPDPGSAR